MSQPVDSEKRPCTFHPAEETRLRCTECERPICPKCMVMYEVGFKCPSCAKKRPSHMEQVERWHYVVIPCLALLAGFVYGWLHPWLMGLLPRLMGFPVLALILVYALGVGAGRLMQRLIRYKVNRRLALLVALGASVGVMAGTPFLWALGEFISVLLSSQNAEGLGGSVAFYVMGRGIELLGGFFFIRGLCRPFQRPF